jgi:methylenetetrahydrofolate--tRNA-(uracil-5-)-methyltransferase
MPEIAVVGGGLAGTEAAWQLAERGHLVSLYEMRPVVTTPAHQTDGLAELVCSNSFKSDEPTNAHGLLKAELRELGSLLLRVAEETRVPAGAALAVDRRLFTQRIGGAIEAQPTIGGAGAAAASRDRRFRSPDIRQAVRCDSPAARLR